MKTFRLVAGILSIVLFFVVMFQSCAAGVVNAIEDKGGSSGSVGMLVALLLLTGGIVSVAVRKNQGKGAGIALVILFGLAALVGFTGYGNYSDLAIWSGWCLINAVLALISVIAKKKSDQ